MPFVRYHCWRHCQALPKGLCPFGAGHIIKAPCFQLSCENLHFSVEGPALSESAHTHLYFEDVLNVLSCFAVVALHCSLTVFGPARGH